MEYLIPIILIIAVFFAPLVLSIIALVRTSRMQSDLASLNRQLKTMICTMQARADMTASVPTPSPAPAPPAPPTPPPTPKPAPSVSVPAATIPPPAPALAMKAPPSPPITPPPTEEEEESKTIEFTLGGKAASFIGIAALVMGVVFFVGYAIQHQWIGPAARILMGLAAGGILIGVGHLAHRRGPRLKALARALTGGGAALFYFSVFAAYGIYGLIDALWAAIGLVASATGVLGLAVFYNSQAVALLGVLGAFIAPLLIGGDFREGYFPLIFVAAVNIPVIVLGLRHKWQWLYNLAFLFTLLLAGLWIEEGLPIDWVAALVFVLIYFAEFIALALLKLRNEAQASGRFLDIFRLVAASLALLGALYWIFERQHHDWLGAVFLAAAIAHLALARAGWRWLPRFQDEILTLLLGALTFASLAVPVQLDGVWVSLGWGLEGVILAWAALRVNSGALQIAAILLGLLGLFKSMFFDLQFYLHPPTVFLNGRFAVSLFSAFSLGLQGWMHDRHSRASGETEPSPWGSLLGGLAILGALLTVFVDSFFTLHADDPWPWMITTLALLACGLSAGLLFSRGSPLKTFGAILLLALPLKLALLDVSASWILYTQNYPRFLNAIFWLQLAALAAPALLAPALARGGAAPRAASALGPLSVLAGLFVVTAELARMNSPWAIPLITLWWSGSALTMSVWGLIRRRAWMRYMALLVFGATILKVFIVDLGDLRGLQRIAAFFGVGILLLALSFAYQKISPLLVRSEKSGHPKP